MVHSRCAARHARQRRTGGGVTKVQHATQHQRRTGGGGVAESGAARHARRGRTGGGGADVPHAKHASEPPRSNEEALHKRGVFGGCPPCQLNRGLVKEQLACPEATRQTSHQPASCNWRNTSPMKPTAWEPARWFDGDQSVETVAAVHDVQVGTGKMGDELGGTEPTAYEPACWFNRHSRNQRRNQRAGWTENCQSKPQQRPAAVRQQCRSNQTRCLRLMASV
jgi:hypothetical protein